MSVSDDLSLLTLSQTTNFTLLQTEKSLQTIISNLMKMVESPEGDEQFLLFPQCF